MLSYCEEDRSGAAAAKGDVDGGSILDAPPSAFACLSKEKQSPSSYSSDALLSPHQSAATESRKADEVKL